MVKFKVLIFSVVAVVLLLGCSSNSNPSQKAAPENMVSQATKDWRSDGIISDGEYTTKKMLGEIEVFTKVEGDTVMIAMRANTTGWLALGLDPDEKMKGADILMCYVKDSQAVVVDMFSTGPYGPHPADEQQGGKSDITMVSGNQKDGITLVEFKRKLDTGDSKDKALKLGENKVIWAVGNTNEINMKHGRRGYGTLELK